MYARLAMISFLVTLLAAASIADDRVIRVAAPLSTPDKASQWPGALAGHGHRVLVAWYEMGRIRGTSIDLDASELPRVVHELGASSLPPQSLDVVIVPGGFVITWGDGDLRWARRADAEGRPIDEPFLLPRYGPKCFAVPDVPLRCTWTEGGMLYGAWSDSAGNVTVKDFNRGNVSEHVIAPAGDDTFFVATLEQSANLQSVNVVRVDCQDGAGEWTTIETNPVHYWNPILVMLGLIRAGDRLFLTRSSLRKGTFVVGGYFLTPELTRLPPMFGLGFDPMLMTDGARVIVGADTNEGRVLEQVVYGDPPSAGSERVVYRQYVSGKTTLADGTVLGQGMWCWLIAHDRDWYLASYELWIHVSDERERRTTLRRR